MKATQIELRLTNPRALITIHALNCRYAIEHRCQTGDEALRMISTLKLIPEVQGYSVAWMKHGRCESTWEWVRSAANAAVSQEATNANCALDSEGAYRRSTQ